MDKNTQKELLQMVKNNYDDIADNFDMTRKKPNWPEMVKLTADIKDGDSILDVGCGNGRLESLFAEKDIKYLGVDPSEKLVELAVANVKNKKSRVIVGDILNLGKINEMNFDYVYCIAVLHHLPGQKMRIKALQQLKNKVAPDGKIIITVWNLWRHKKCLRLIWKFWLLKLLGKNKMDFGDILFPWKNSQGDHLSQRYYHAFTKRQLKKIAKKAGLKVEKIYKGRSKGLFFPAVNYYLILKK